MLVSFMGGMWFDLSLMGSTFQTIANFLPFTHAVAAARAPLMDTFTDLPIHLLWTTAYAVIVFSLTISVFNGKMQGDNK